MLSRVISDNHTAHIDKMLGFNDIKSHNNNVTIPAFVKKGNEIDINVIKPLYLIIMLR